VRDGLSKRSQTLPAVSPQRGSSPVLLKSQLTCVAYWLNTPGNHRARESFDAAHEGQFPGAGNHRRKGENRAQPRDVSGPSSHVTVQKHSLWSVYLNSW
jgi:hypothetical protein